MTDSPLGDYVEVKDRLADFHARFPTGRVVAGDPVWITDTPHGPGWLVTVAVYRDDSPDALPAGRASSFMAVPGLTNFTRRSEVENVETSAAGRALALAGIAAQRGVASADDVRRAQADAAGTPRGAAKGTVLAAAKGDRDVAGAWWAAAFPDDPDHVPDAALALLCRLVAADVDVAPEPAETPSDALEADEAPTTPDDPTPAARAALEAARAALTEAAP